MYLIHNGGKSVATERFIRTLKTKIYTYMTSISKNVYADKLDDIVDEYNNIYHGTIKMKPVNVKGYTPNWSEEVFVIKKVKNTAPWTYVINDLTGKEIIGTFYEKEPQKTNRKEFRIEKVIKRKDDKLYVKWKGYDSSFNSWIDKKDLV